jgi:hypothetical protein
VRDFGREKQLACDQRAAAQAQGECADTECVNNLVEAQREWTAWKLSNTDRAEALDVDAWLALGGLLS